MTAACSYRAILRLVWPLALGMANNAIMQFTDRVFLARESALSLEAVLPAAMLAAVFVAFFQSVVTYSGTFTAQYHGAGDETGCRRSYQAGLVLTALSTFAFVAFIPLGDAVFAWAGHAPELMARERIYYDIVMGGAPALCTTLVASGYLTARGRTRVVFWVNVLGNALNIALDPLLIFGCGPFAARGIAGAAIATVAAQAVQALVMNVIVWRDLGRRPRGTASAVSARTRAQLTWDILRYGASAGGYQVLALLSFTLFLFVSAAAGSTALAVSNAIFTINYLIFAPMEGFAIGAGVLVGQCQGARDSARAALAGTRVLRLALVYNLGICALLYVFRTPILSLFTGNDPAVSPAEFFALGNTLLLLSFTWQLFDAVDTVLAGALKGAGDTRFVMGWMLVSAFVVWMPLVFLVRAFHPTMPLFWATMIAYVAVLFIGTYLRWRRGPWRRIRLV